MKVLLLTDRMDVGGAETHVAQLARGLSALGVGVALLSGGGRLSERLQEEGVEQWFEDLPTHNLLRLFKIRRRIRRRVRAEGFAILHAHARVPALLIRGCHKWSNPDGSHPAGIVTAHAHFSASGLLPYLCHWGDATVAVSEDLRRYLRTFYRLPAERIRVIRNGVDCRRFFPSPHGAEEPPSILFASRLDADCSRGAELLCRIAPSLCAAFPSLRITLAGGGDQKEELARRAEAVNRLLGYEAIRMRGAVEEMAPLLQEHDILVGVSRVAMEAAACGLAIVLCGNEGYLGILQRENAETALLSNLCGRGAPSAEEERLEEDLRLLLSDAALRRESQEFSRQFATEHLNADDMCRRTLALYHRVRWEKKDLLLTVGGYFGCGNLGDDAILQGLLEELSNSHPHVELLALTDRPRRSKGRFGVTCVHRKNPLSVGRALFLSDGFLCGGGSLLQNLTSRRSLYYYLGLLRQAKRMGCVPVLFAAGIGPLLGERDPARTAAVLRECPYIGLRDEVSRQQLMALGLDPALLHVGADPAIFLPAPPRGRSHALLQELGLPRHGGLLCVVLRECADRDLPLRLIPAAVRTLCARRELTPLFLCFDAESDGEIGLGGARASNALFLTPEEATDARALFSASALVLTMRLHAMILATLEGTPTVGIPADPRDRKIESFAKASGQEVLSPSHISVGALVEQMEQALDSAPARRPLLAQSLAEMRKKARKDLANILQMIYNRDKRD